MAKPRSRSTSSWRKPQEANLLSKLRVGSFRSLPDFPHSDSFHDYVGLLTTGIEPWLTAARNNPPLLNGMFALALQFGTTSMTVVLLTRPRLSVHFRCRALGCGHSHLESSWLAQCP